ncbi:MAG: carbohydrate ABC transporter permease [Chloroflexi bacterium]|nr:carbohydrate ABC transporter permease [Chloroflexota bacterium]
MPATSQATATLRSPSARALRTLRQGVLYLSLTALALVFLFPFYWLVSTSVKPQAQLFLVPPVLVPYPLMWGNYPKMLEFMPFVRFIGNTLAITVLVLGGVLFSCPMGAYSFARVRWPGRNVVFIGVLATMMLPHQVTLIPQYLLFKELSWINTWQPLWVPAWFGSAFYIFLLRQFFLTIPRELEDAAKIDGAGYFTIFIRIMVPLIGPAIATVAVFTFMTSWNDFVGPLIYINNPDLMPIALALRMFQNLYQARFDLMMAAATIMALPPVILFFFAQRYFIQGIALTGLKG